MKVLILAVAGAGFALYAAQNYGVNVVGDTISKEQAAYAQACCKGLSDRN